MKTKWLLVMVLLLTLVACGGASTPTGGTGGTASTAVPATAVPVAAGDAVAGKALYTSNCSACHGPEGQGMPGLGKDMTTSEFIAAQSDAELMEFIKVGRGPTDPGNTTGVAMPPKGGNPALTDEQITDIIAWIRSIHQ